jgi:general stress protein YciG
MSAHSVCGMHTYDLLSDLANGDFACDHDIAHESGRKGWF